MKFLKNLLAIFALFGLVAFAPVRAEEISDVDADYWATTEINEMVSQGVMKLQEGSFLPEDFVSRADFVSMLVNVLGHKDLTVKVSNPYADVNEETENYSSIMKSEEIGLVYGYPDETFRPDNNMTRAEVTSVMSHITQNMLSDQSLLEQFNDSEEIPEWALQAYAKSVKYGLYVNNPDLLALEPNREITRAETAVLLYKLSKALGVVKKEYVAPKEITKSVEHLNIHPDAENDVVTITNFKKIISSGNILKADFADVYKSKKSQVGDEVVFVIANDVITSEGTTVIPAGAKLYSTVEDIIKPKWFNKNAEVKVKFNRLELADGRTSDLEGYIFNNRNGYLKESPWKKLGFYSLGGALVGTGLGMGIGIPNHETGAGFAIGIPVGAGVGAAAGLITKGVNYKANAGETVFIKLLNNVNINEDL